MRIWIKMKKTCQFHLISNALITVLYILSLWILHTYMYVYPWLWLVPSRVNSISLLIFEYNMTIQNVCSVKALPNQVRKAGHDYSYMYKEFERLIRKCKLQRNVLQNRILKLNTLSNKRMGMLCFCNLYLFIIFLK